MNKVTRIDNESEFFTDLIIESLIDLDFTTHNEIKEIFEVYKIEDDVSDDDYCIELFFKHYFESRDYLKGYIYRTFIGCFYIQQEKTQDYSLSLSTNNEDFNIMILQNNESEMN